MSTATATTSKMHHTALQSTVIAQADAAHLPLADGAADLVFTSPPYVDARTYGIDAQRDCVEWVEWMLEVVTELTRVCSGVVLINCAGVTRERVYQPAPEGLCWEWYKRGGNLWRPSYWNRVGIPGSGGKQWLRADIEYVFAFKRDREWLPWADNTANGHPPKWGPGGEMSHRLSDGKRVNQWGPVGSAKGFGHRFHHGKETEGDGAPRPSHVTAFGNRPSSLGRRANGERKEAYLNGKLPDGAQVLKFPGAKREDAKRLANGKMEDQIYIPPTLANPGNFINDGFAQEDGSFLVRTKVGGGHQGHALAHENEASFPVDLPMWFIRSWCPPGGWVLDPFGGSGTTADAAWRLGRRAITFDLRFSQCELSRRRLGNPNYSRPAKRQKHNGEMQLWPSLAKEEA